MKIKAKVGREDIAIVYIAEVKKGNLIEFVEALQPPLKREEKWVLMVSTLYGCPVKCLMCDAGGNYRGKLSKEEIFMQIDYMVRKRFKDFKINVKKFKIQFARMGEPTFNDAVLEVLEEFPKRYDAPGFIPSISTIAPRNREKFFERLTQIKDKKYSNGNFQLQFSIHTTDEKLRDKITPVPKWNFREIAEYGERFYKKGDRKITLNFALAKDFPFEPEVLLRYFAPEKFFIKITPLNPTYRAVKNFLNSYIDPKNPEKKYEVVEKLKLLGYDIMVSIGEVEENRIGSNCGQYVLNVMNKAKIKGSYEYNVLKP